MVNKIIFVVTLFAYSIVVSQSFMYIIALKNVQLNLDAKSYIELRKLIDINMTNNFKYVIYAAMLANFLLIIFNLKFFGGILFISSAIAFAALIVDALIAVKVNLPINHIIHTWSPDYYPANWADYRTKWLCGFQYRQIANITGFLSLLIGAVFKVM